MKRLLVGAVLTAVLVACTTTTSSTPGTAPGGDPGGSEGAARGPDAEDADDAANQPPHALGTIVLGESHVAGGTAQPSPIVSASFVPDALAAQACRVKIEGTCELTPRPTCTKVPDSRDGCRAGEACTLDASCAAVCTKLPTCAADCAANEVCRVGANGQATCVKDETFDAGTLAFRGTTTAITLNPPYRYSGKADGAPFLAGSELRVQASGAVAAGFLAFDETFTSTSFVQTNPPLHKIAKTAVFGSGPLTVGWVPGNDSITITLSASGGTVTCKASDAAGSFDVPRAAVEAAIGKGVPAGGPATTNLIVSVARSKKDVKKDKKTKGTLSGVTIPDQAWLELVTTSIESTTFQGCAPGSASCGGVCVDLTNDDANCGACGVACGSGKACNNRSCIAAACDACLDGTETGACKTSWDACKANAACKAYLDCQHACTTAACASACLQANPGAKSYLDPLNTCIATTCASACR